MSLGKYGIAGKIKIIQFFLIVFFLKLIKPIISGEKLILIFLFNYFRILYLTGY